MQNRNYSRQNTGQKYCFARNVRKESSGFLSSINTFVSLKQGIHTEWGVFDEMKSMLFIEDAIQKGCKFFRLRNAVSVSFAEEKMEYEQSAFLLQVSGSPRATLSIRSKF